jgi:hypothetical protein
VGRFALLVGVSEYRDEDLPKLPSALRDVRAMQEVLLNAELGGFHPNHITVLENPARQQFEEAIEILFQDRKEDDLLVFYFSGHGITDEKGKLYWVTPQTRKNRGNLSKATAVAATVLHDNMSSSSSKHQVLILDSCFSGAIAEGLTVKSGSNVDIQRELGGKGRAILTSSSAVQKSFHIQGYDLSIYTHYLIEGIQTGAANQEGNDYITVDDLHEYVKKKLEQEAPLMTPQFFPVKEGHKINLVRSPKPKGDPELEYRQEAEARLFEGEFSPTARKLLNRKQDKLGLSPEQAEAIEAEVKKPWQERQRKLQEYEENLLEELNLHRPLPNRILILLDDYRQELGLRPEDVEPIHQKLEVSLILPQPVSVEAEPSPAVHEPLDKLASEKGIDYTKLRDLLKAQNWYAADDETYKVMITAIGKEEGEWFEPEELLNFPCTDLRTIDQLWVNYSEGKFGFSVQKQIYVDCGAKLDGNYPGKKIWEKFGDRVGWRKDGNWLKYDELNPSLSSPKGNFPVVWSLNPSLSSPKGNFPGCGWGWVGGFYGERGSLLSHRDL